MMGFSEAINGIIKQKKPHKRNSVLKELKNIRKRLRGVDERVGVKVLAVAMDTETNEPFCACFYVDYDERFADEVNTTAIATSICKKLGIRELRYDQSINMSKADYSPTVTFFFTHSNYRA